MALTHRANWIPFTLRADQEHPKMWNTQRIIEALIIGVLTAVVTASIVSYSSNQVLNVKLETLSRDMSDMKQSINRIQQDFYPPVNRHNNRD